MRLAWGSLLMWLLWLMLHTVALLRGRSVIKLVPIIMIIMIIIIVIVIVVIVVIEIIIIVGLVFVLL